MGASKLNYLFRIFLVLGAIGFYDESLAATLGEEAFNKGDSPQLDFSECFQHSEMDCPALCQNSNSQCYKNEGNETELCICDNKKEEIPHMENSYLCSEDPEDASYTYGLVDREPNNIERCQQECKTLSGDYEPKYCIRQEEPRAGKFVCACYQAKDVPAQDVLQTVNGEAETMGEKSPVGPLSEQATRIDKKTKAKEKKGKKKKVKPSKGKESSAGEEEGDLPPGSVLSPGNEKPYDCNYVYSPGAASNCAMNMAAQPSASVSG